MYALRVQAQTVLNLLHAQIETGFCAVVARGNWLGSSRNVTLRQRTSGCEGRKSHRKEDVGGLGHRSGRCEGEKRRVGERRGRREVWILVPAALLLGARLTSARPAHGRSPLPISTDGLRGASRSRKKYKTTVRLLLSFLLRTFHKPWPFQGNLWQVKPPPSWLPSRYDCGGEKRDEPPRMNF